MKNFDVAIIGGGIAGITLAIALHRRDVQVKIYEQAAAFGEIGAGVSFSPNAVQAMKLCHEGVYAAFTKVCTNNMWPSKKKIWFDYVDGFHDVDKLAFSISNSLGQNAVHRARFLDEMVRLIPKDIAYFGKRLRKLSEKSDGRLLMEFEDGSSSEADAVIGCDGIKSRVRQSMFGEDHPCANPSYTHKYAYRGLVPMEDAVATIGEEWAQNACMHMGPGGHVLTFPVNHGQTLNIVAFKTDPGDWPDLQKMTRTAERSDLLRDFCDYSEKTKKLLGLTGPQLDIWAIFDLMANLPPSYAKGRVCISGDAAHATSPHHGAGAGVCIEDSVILAELIADERVTSHKELAAAFSTFDAQRRGRGEFLVRSSRFIGECYEWQAESVGHDFKKIEEEINKRNGIIANVDIAAMCEEARAELGERTGLESKM